MLTSSRYKPAKLYTANLDISKRWYVYYHYLIPGSNNKWKMFKLKMDINRIHNVKDRLYEGNQLEKWMNNKLKNGYNPFAEAGTVFTANQPIEKQLQTIFDEQFAGESKDTTNSYKEHFNRFMKFINEKNLDQLSMAEITDEICDQYRNYVIETVSENN